MKDKLVRMKANPGDKLVEQFCETCEFNFGSVCVGYGTRTDNGEQMYVMPMTDAEVMFPHGCEEYRISLEAFIEQEQMNGR